MSEKIRGDQYLMNHTLVALWPPHWCAYTQDWEVQRAPCDGWLFWWQVLYPLSLLIVPYMKCF